MSELPNPLTPADCDLRGYRWMPLDVERVIDSDTFGLSTGDEFKTAFRLWAKSWSQIPAASLPDDDRLLAHLAGLSENMPKWKKVKVVALRGWILCSDGRLYHAVIAEKALESMGKREQHNEREENEQSRQQRYRERRKALFETLRERGIIPSKDTKTDELERLVALHQASPTVTQNVTGDVTANVTHDVAATAIDSTRPDQTRQDSKPKPLAALSVVPSPQAPETPDALPEIQSTLNPEQREAVPLVVKLRALGVTITSANPLAAEWISRGLTLERVPEVVEFARLKGKPEGPIHPNFINALLDDALHPPAPKPKKDDWHRTDEGIARKAKELRVSARAGWSYGQLKDAVWEEIRRLERQGATA